MSVVFRVEKFRDCLCYRVKTINVIRYGVRTDIGYLTVIGNVRLLVPWLFLVSVLLVTPFDRKTTPGRGNPVWTEESFWTTKRFPRRVTVVTIHQSKGIGTQDAGT